MYKECKKCKERMMIVQEGCPAYTFGSYIIYGCPECGYLEYKYDEANIEINPITFVDGDKDINKYHVSN